MFLKKLYFAIMLMGRILLSAQSVGGVTTGAATYCDSINSGFISLTVFNGSVLYWESSENNGLFWKKIYNTTSTQSYTQLKTITHFRAIVKDGTFLQDTSSVSIINVYVRGNTGTITGEGHFCANSGNGQLNLTNAPGKVIDWQNSLGTSNIWMAQNNTSTLLNYSNIEKTTSYRAIVETILGCANDTTEMVTIKIDPKTIAGNILNADTVCYGTAGDTLQLQAYNGIVLNWFYSTDKVTWNPINTSAASITYTTVTQNIYYKATVKNGICTEETTNPVAVILHNVTPANAGPDQNITKHDPLSLNGSGNGTPKWDNENTLSDPNIFTPNANPLHTTQYKLTLTDRYSCTSSDSVLINVTVPVPSAITPNGDGVNDYFKIDKIYDYPNNSLHIFNRWGIEIYQASPYTNEWNGKNSSGKDLPDDIYYYVFDYGDGQEIITAFILIKR